jgi:hypothetical protein
MHVGVPARRQWQSQVVGEPRPQHSHLARPGNVNQVRLESFQHFPDQGNVAQKPGIEAQIFLEREGQEPARQLQRPDVSLFPIGLGLIAAAHAQKGQIPPPRKRLKVAAGMRYTVDLMKGVRKIRHARHIGFRRVINHRIESLGEHAGCNQSLAIVLAQRQPQLMAFAPCHAQPV